MPNALHHGGNLHVPRDGIADGSVGLIGLDPPFKPDANCNALFRAPAPLRHPSSKLHAAGHGAQAAHGRQGSAWAAS